MKKKTIAVDVDDVLAASADGFIEFSNKKWGTHLTLEDYDERWALMWKVDHTEGVRRAKEIYDSDVFTRLENVENAQIVLRELSKKYKLVITTSRAKSAKEDTEAWINKHYSGIFSEIHLTGFYDKVTPESHKHTKADLLQEVGADWLIDDHPKHCIAAAKAGIKTLLFGDYSWNRHVKQTENIIKVNDWLEVADYFNVKI